MMKTFTLNNGVVMPALGYGVFKLTDSAECTAGVIEAVKTGYRLIDTAQAYGNEEAVGAGIKACGVDRGELFITTKLWFKSFETADAERALEKSFEKLGLDYIDMVLLHWPFGNVYAAWRVLEKYYDAGRIRAIGVSNFEPDRLIDLISFNRIRPAVNQIETHLFCQQTVSHAWMAKYGVAHQAYAPLGRGVNGMFETEAVKAAAAAHGKTPAQIALRFLIDSDVAVIPKSAHAERIHENADLFDFEFTPDELAALRALDKHEAMIGRPADPIKVETAMHW